MLPCVAVSATAVPSAAAPAPHADGAPRAAAARGSRLAASTRRVVLFANARVLPDAGPDRWLVQLRWLALLGMTGTALVSRALVPALRLGPILATIGAIALSNVAWTALVWRAGAGAARFVRAQLAVDLGAVTLLLWLSGGLFNPFVVFLSVHTVFAGILCSRRDALVIGALTLVAAGLLATAPPVSFEDAFLGPSRTRLLAQLVAMAHLMAFIAFFIVVYRERMRRLQQEGLRNEKLAMLGRLVGGLSHELRTPLATIAIAGRELAEIDARAEPDEARALARTIADEAARASDIVGLVGGQVRPDHRAERIELGAFVEAFAHRELDRLGFDGERVFELAPGVCAQVLRVALEQLLRNLLANAVEAMRAAPAPEAEHGARPRRRLELSVSGTRRQARVTLRDSGPGFPPEVLARLGEPFQTTKSEHGGVGLGLYVCSVLAERMSAELHVESTAGTGAQVVVVFERAASPADADGRVQSRGPAEERPA